MDFPILLRQYDVKDQPDTASQSREYEPEPVCCWVAEIKEKYIPIIYFNGKVLVSHNFIYILDAVC